MILLRNMIKNCIWVILFLSLGIGIILMAGYKKNNRVCINENCFQVEIAESGGEKRRGLSFRESLPEGSGMLFVYDKEDYYSFWMKDMNFPIDIIWINKEKEVVHIERNLQPCGTDSCKGYKPSQKAMYVLEINPGLDIKIGDKANF